MHEHTNTQVYALKLKNSPSLENVAKFLSSTLLVLHHSVTSADFYSS